MYYILGIKFQNFNWFEEAFTHQQEHHPEKKIIYSNNDIVEVVWNPAWEHYSVKDNDVVFKKYAEKE